MTFPKFPPFESALDVLLPGQYSMAEVMLGAGLKGLAVPSPCLFECWLWNPPIMFNESWSSPWRSPWIGTEATRCQLWLSSPLRVTINSPFWKEILQCSSVIPDWCVKESWAILLKLQICGQNLKLLF